MKKVAFRYRLHLEIYYEDGTLEINPEITNLQTVVQLCKHHIQSTVRRKVAAIYLTQKSIEKWKFE